MQVKGTRLPSGRSEGHRGHGAGSTSPVPPI